jgi:molecular chaperone GrpE (heat shock protein)
MKEYEDLSEKIIAQSAEPETENDQNDELMEILLNTREQGQMVEQLIKNQIDVKDDMINRLHRELDYYRQGAEDRFVDQLMKAVIKVRKDMVKLVSSDRWGTLTVDDLRREYQYSMEDITDLLEQQNVDPYRSEPGDIFNAAIHQAKIEVTDDISLDKKIKRSLSDGYMKDTKVLIPERVVVYQYRA